MGASANRNSEQRNAKRAFIADLQLFSANSFAALAPRPAAGSLQLGTSVGKPEIAFPPRAIVLIAPSSGAGVLRPCGQNHFFARSFSKFFSSLMNSWTSLKSMYTLAKRTYATLSSFFRRCMIISPISVVVSSRSVASCTTPSISSTMASSFGVATGRFSHAFNSPCKIFCRSNRSRLPSFLITMYGISSIRSYVVNRRSHFKHSRRRRIVSPVRPSRESITLSSRFPQKGHFTPAFLPCRPVQELVPHFRARQFHRALLFRAPPVPAGYRGKRLRGSAAEFPRCCIRQKSPATAQSRPQRPSNSLHQTLSCTRKSPAPAIPSPPPAIALPTPPA